MNTQNTTTERVQKFATYREYANQWLIDNGIKLKTVFIQDGNYNPYFIYLNRVSRYDKNKANFRILQRGKDTVKNCIMVTFDTERHDREYLCYLIQNMQPVLKQWCNGSCQTFITQYHVAMILSGAINRNGQVNKEVLY